MNNQYNIFTLSKKYLGNNFDHYYPKLLNYCRQYDIDEKNKYTAIQIGGEIYTTNINGFDYSIDYSINKGDDNTLIYFNNPNKNDLVNMYCVMLGYSNNDDLNIIIIDTPKKCLNVIADQKGMIKDKLKYGDIMIKLIINYAKENGFKKIKLDDESKFYCLDTKNKLSYDLKYGHTLTYGYPWYYKYGFKYINKNEHSKVKDNYKKIKKIITKDILFNDFNIIILNNLFDVESNFVISDDAKEITSYLFLINELYNKYYNLPITEFFNEFVKSNCKVMTRIDKQLFVLLKLELLNINLQYNDNKMELIL